MDLKLFKKAYDLIGNDYLKGTVLTLSEVMNIKKDIVRLDTNNFCNIKCVMCDASYAQIGKESHVMGLEQYKKIIDKVKKRTRFLYLSCSFEPLATPNFINYLKYAKDSNIPFISFCTNALLLNDDNIHSLVDNQINEIIISFNGFVKEDYERIMFKSNYDKVVSNIRSLNKYKKEKKSIYPKIRINSILMKTNLKNFDNIVNFINEFDIEAIQLRDLCIHEDQNNVEEVKDEMISNLDMKELKIVIQKINVQCEKLKKSRKQIILPKKILDMSIDDKKYANINKRGCSIPFFSYWIKSDGQIRACLSDERGFLGNILLDEWSVIKLRRDEFKKLALKNKCDRKTCVINVDSSSIV